MHEEEFAQGRSLIHLLDPRLKIVLTLVFAVIIAVSSKYGALLTGLCGSVILVLAARINLFLVLRRLVVVNVFIALMWLFLPFTTPGVEYVKIGPFPVTIEGIRLAFLITLKSNTIVLAGMALLSTISLINFGHALSSLKIPNKLVQLFFFTIRYSYTVHEQYEKIRNTLRVRCFRPKTGMHTYRTYAHIVSNLLLCSFERSERILSAMKCRGFKNRFHTNTDFHFHGRDILFAVIFALFATTIGIAEWTRILYK
jgi:cobalt/nickel transport system permease protein